MSRVIPGEHSPAAGAPTDRKLLLVVGCPRSGTTWLQLLLAQHPRVATCNETWLFYYVNHLHSRWTDECAGRQAPRSIGLSSLLSEAEFYGLCRDFAAGVVAKIGEQRPGAQVVLEKTPDHVLRWELILKLFPNAYFLHIIRDPRAVASSLLAAGRSGWGASWASRSVITATRRWQDAMEAGSRLAKATGRYREVRYESLVSDGPEQLRQICMWLDLRHDPDFPVKAVDACQIDKLRAASSELVAPWSLKEEPPDFFRRGETDSWRKDLSDADVRTLEYLVQDLMVEFGYPLATRGPRRRPVAVRLRRVADAILWRSRRWLDQVDV